MNEIRVCAAVVCGDRALGEMLADELRYVGYSITGEDDADLILTEADLRGYIQGNKKTVVFLSEGAFDDGEIAADAVFPYAFSAEELEKTLRMIFHEIILGREKPLSEEKICRDTGNDPAVKALSDGKSALVGNERIALSSNEWIVLSALCRAGEKGKGVSREELSKALGHGACDGGNIVDVYVCHLRKKIELPIGRRLIFTVRGKGYSLLKGKEGST